MSLSSTDSITEPRNFSTLYGSLYFFNGVRHHCAGLTTVGSDPNAYKLPPRPESPSDSVPSPSDTSRYTRPESGISGD